MNRLSTGPFGKEKKSKKQNKAGKPLRDNTLKPHDQSDERQASQGCHVVPSLC